MGCQEIFSSRLSRAVICPQHLEAPRSSTPFDLAITSCLLAAVMLLLLLLLLRKASCLPRPDAFEVRSFNNAL